MLWHACACVSCMQCSCLSALETEPLVLPLHRLHSPAPQGSPARDDLPSSLRQPCELGSKVFLGWVFSTLGTPNLAPELEAWKALGIMLEIQSLRLTLRVTKSESACEQAPRASVHGGGGSTGLRLEGEDRTAARSSEGPAWGSCLLAERVG